MEGDRISRALARIEAAAARIEGAAGSSLHSRSDPELERRHGELRQQTAAALAELDALIRTAER